MSTEYTTWWRFDSPRRLDGTAALEIDGSRFRFDAALLHVLVSYYAANPLERWTLGTPAALVRARSLDVQDAAGGHGH